MLRPYLVKEATDETDVEDISTIVVGGSQLPDETICFEVRRLFFVFSKFTSQAHKSKDKYSDKQGSPTGKGKLNG